MEALSFKKRNIPNLITILRIILIIPIIVLLLINDINSAYIYKIENITFSISLNQVLAGCFFIIASISDFLDGYLSRKFKWTSNFGKFWDPLADKIVVNVSLVLLAVKNFTFVVFVIIFIIRDLIVDGIRLVNANKKIVISAQWSGKLKTIFQMIAIIILLFLGNNIKQPAWWYWVILNFFVYIALFFSIYSLFEYSYQHLKITRKTNEKNQ